MLTYCMYLDCPFKGSLGTEQAKCCIAFMQALDTHIFQRSYAMAPPGHYIETQPSASRWQHCKPDGPDALSKVAGSLTWSSLVEDDCEGQHHGGAELVDEGACCVGVAVCQEV